MAMVWVMVWEWVMEDCTVTIMDTRGGIPVVTMEAIMVTLILAVLFIQDTLCRIIKVKSLTADRNDQALFHPDGTGI
jgi:hypothetical protein